jgi:N-formylglutamate amidohydrolase
MPSMRAGRDIRPGPGFNRNMNVPLPALPPADTSMPALPFTLSRPARRRVVPVIFASPHSGREYPAEFLAAARLDPHGLRRSEDSFVDELFGDAPDYGAPLLAATFPRAFCDPNREAWELDPAMFAETLPAWVNTASARVSAGLGTIARIVASGESIYRDKLAFAEAERRVRDYWQPYHECLAGLIAENRELHGASLLIDCHSMPAHGSIGRGGGVDFVLGDAFATTCAPKITRLVEEVLTSLGYTVRRNDPYAGGFITRHYGRPRENLHALQIEIARPLYMNEVRIEHGPRFSAVREDIGTLIAALTAEAAALLRA